MALTLTTIPEPQLPPMAWLVTIDGSHATVHHGARVETWETGFFEGAYAGRWLDDDPSLATDVFGSGMVIRDDAFHLVTPSHTLEALYYCQCDDVTTASNSLAFLVERLGIDVPARYDYGERFASLALGIVRYRRDIADPLARTVRRCAHHNLVVDGNGVLSETLKPIGRGFSGYSAYISHLDEALGSTFNNAKDSRRNYLYQPASTISSGYDSPMVTALSLRHGLDRAYAVDTARDNLDDSGHEIARVLGIETEIAPRSNDRDEGLNTIAPFAATGMGSEDLVYSGITSRLSGHILLTGFQGTIWQTDSQPNDELFRDDWSGSSLQEHRIESSFIHMPVPMIAIPHHGEVFRLTQSEELRPFRRFQRPGYDKPIPRRFLENMGVPGDLFGQEKKAASILLFSDKSLRQQLTFRNHSLSESTRADVIERAARLGASPLGMPYRLAVVRWNVTGKLLWYGVRARSAGRKLRRRAPAPIRTAIERITQLPHIAKLDKRFQAARRMHKFNAPATSVMFLVGLDLVRERYRQPEASNT